MENDNKSLNPWVSMWTQPRRTIQQIVDGDPEHLVLLPAFLTGFAQSLNRASGKSMGDDMEWPMIFLVAVIAGPIGGLISLYVGGALIRWTGRYLGGSASPENIRAAIAWSGVPVIWTLILYVPGLALFGQELFTSETPRIDASSSLMLIYLVFSLIEVTIGIWALVVFLKSLGQVQGFSAWKALGNVILSVLVIVIPLVTIVLGITALSQG
jgi:heme/copper-type cytochrome/quinol oxidase subunit 2